VDAAMITERRFVTTAELSDLLHVPKSTIYHRAKANDWPTYHIGRTVRFDLDEILDLIRRDAP
jgi:excisionase family DNA binding protein